MALDPHPDELGCANQWRHGKAHLPAAAFVADATREWSCWTPRCQGCVNSLAAANPASARALVVYIDPTRQRRPTPDHDGPPVDYRCYRCPDHCPDPAP
jgi:hypothetical protein